MKERSLAIFAFVLLLGLAVGVAASSGEDAKGDVWKDPASGLTWQVSPTGGEMEWPAAKTHCESLSLGGSSDWRLPTISELRSLVRGCDKTKKGGSCKVTDSCLKYKSCRSSACIGCLVKKGPGSGGAYWPPELSGDVSWYWSSSAVADVGRYRRWVVGFYDGYVTADNGRVGSNDYDVARCVH